MQVQYVVKGATIRGIEAIPVDVEILISSGLPSFLIVGMPDAAIQEARERVRGALRASGFSMPAEKVVVNLAPGALKKTGSGFDFPIAVGLLAATKQIGSEWVSRSLLVGELSLDGKVRPVKGLLAYAVCARECGLDFVCAQPEEGLIELRGLMQKRVETLSQLKTEEGLTQGKKLLKSVYCASSDFSDIAGHDIAKRALQIAAAGGHGVLMIGPPGSGKTMLASRLPSILPPLDENERLETARIYSVAGLDLTSILSGVRPFRSPHHSASLAGLIGGGTPPRPGEASLAHNGILFLDELAEFKPSTLQGIRQPMECGMIAVTRAEGNIFFPARFMLVAATNPCPCGYYGDTEITCTCRLSQVKNYQNRIGGPLIDRIDIHIDVWRTQAKQVLQTGRGSSSDSLREKVLQAREFRKFREEKQKDTRTSSASAVLLRACMLTAEDERYLEEMAELYRMSGRGIMRALAIARTIADMEENEGVKRLHLCEALNLRIQEGVGGAYERTFT